MYLVRVCIFFISEYLSNMWSNLLLFYLMREKFPLITVAVLILSLIFVSLLVLSTSSISFSPYLPSLLPNSFAESNARQD